MFVNESGKTSRSSKGSPFLEAISAECTAQLEKLIATSALEGFASLSTVDGRVFAHTATASNIQGSRVSALTSSILALCESLSKEVLLGPCDYSAISSVKGSVVLVRVPTAHQNFILSVGADSTENIAMVLRKTLDAAQLLGETLDRSPLHVLS